MTIDKNCKVIDAQHSHLEPEINVPLYGLFMIYSEMENHKEFVCASDDKDKLKLKAYERESKYIYDEVFDADDILSLEHIDYAIHKIKVI